jgi:hypothetical protein
MVGITPALRDVAGAGQRLFGVTPDWAGFATVVAGVATPLAKLVRARRTPARPGPKPMQTLLIQIDFGFSLAASHLGADRGTAGLGADDWIAMVRREVDELAVLADHVHGLLELTDHEPEVAEETFVRLDDLRWLLASYVIKGGRIRRLIQLPDLLRSIDAVHRPEASRPAGTIGAIRAAATDLLQRIKTTNAVTADWLIAHRVALPDPDFLDSNALLGRYDRLEVEPTSISGDPLYLLTAHLHDVLETVDSLGAVDHSVLDVLETQLFRILTEVGAEITSAQVFNTALIALARQGRSAEAA